MKKGSDDISESILLAHIRNQVSPLQKKEVEQWLLASPENQKYYNDLRKIWEKSAQLHANTVVVDVDNAWKKVAQRIGKDQVATKPVIIRLFKQNPFARIAAVLIVLIAVTGVIYFTSGNGNNNEQIVFAQNEIVVETLNDGSVVSLNQNSELTYPKLFNENERRVKLKGEAFFEIKPDQLHPFVVELNHQASVTVLGTSFNIRENETTTEVFVKTGKVEFASKKSKVILTAGEKATLNQLTGEIEKNASETLNFNEIYWLDKKLNFQEMKLSGVVQILSAIFDKSIVLENEDTGNCLITTRFEGESLEHILNVIASSFDMEVVINKNGYILKGNGC